jgi:hypothetical protein
MMKYQAATFNATQSNVQRLTVSGFLANQDQYPFENPALNVGLDHTKQIIYFKTLKVVVSRKIQQSCFAHSL